jgi:plastocyanin
MKSIDFGARARIAAILFMVGVATRVYAVPPIDVVNADLDPLIDAAAPHAVRFAVNVPHKVSLGRQGEWQDSGSTSTWTYSTRIPTAVSMSFHASTIRLPPSAVLEVTGARSSMTYRSREARLGELWARPLIGDEITVSISVAKSQRSQVRLEIDGFQAGYRSLGHATPDHPRYRQLVGEGASTSSCSLNYSCQATAANQGPANATVAIIVGNILQCTGTLLNDTQSDGTPYVLTARHCESGELGGGNPGAATSISVYWDAVTPCGQTLASIYDGAAVTQLNAVTVVEQQDAWLVRLLDRPAAADAFYAGWDATGGVFSNGYSIHHALGSDKQYVEWYGQAITENISAATINVGYASTFWGVVNQMGNVGAGASGGALFDPNNHVVGSASLAQLVNGPNTAGVCPVTPPPTPSPSTVTALYTSFAGVWNSTVDATSSTGSATIESVLDNAHTGALVIDGAASIAVSLSSSSAGTSSVITGQPITLTWSAAGASSCMALGGLSGDGWTGTLPASGSLQVTEQAGGNVTYSLACTASGHLGGAAVMVTWIYTPVSVLLNGPTTQIGAGSTFQLSWSVNGQPCTASGGAPGDGWAGTQASTGSQNIVATTIGTFTYTLTCGTGARVGTGQTTVTVVPPSVSNMLSDANDLRIGQSVTLQWSQFGSCVGSGGVAGDGFTGVVFTKGGTLVTESVAGTYTLTVICSGGGQSASDSTTLTFVSAAPAVSFAASPTNLEVYTDPGANNSLTTLTWSSNVRPCSVAFAGPGNWHGQLTLGLATGEPLGSAQDSEWIAGAYIYTITCGSGQNQGQASAPVTYFTTQPAVTLTVSPQWPQGFSTEISWSSNVFPCTATGGASGDGWAGAVAGPSGHQMLTEAQLGAVTFGMRCGSGSQIVQAQTSTQVQAVTTSISPSATSIPVGDTVTFAWNSNFTPCTLNISPGTAGTQPIYYPGTQFEDLELVPGIYTYTISCAGESASAQVTFTGADPQVSLSATPTTSPVNGLVTLTWSFLPTALESPTCIPSGGISGDGWSGASLYNSGSQSVTSAVAQTVAYSISCTYGQYQAQAQTQVTYSAVGAAQPTAPTPAVTLTAGATTETVGTGVKLSWSSMNAASCQASGGASGDGWSGNLALSGSMTINETQAGSFTYGVTCSGVPPAATANATVSFSAKSSGSGSGGSGTSGSTGSGGGGGGTFDWLAIGILALAKALGDYRCRRT